MNKLTTSADTNPVNAGEAGLSEVSIQTLDTYRGIAIHRTADVNKFPAPTSDQFCFVARYRLSDDAPVLSTHASIKECRDAIDDLAEEAGYARPPQRTPEQIIGRDRVLQLDFEGYEIAPIGALGTLDEVNQQAGNVMLATAVGMSTSLDAHAVFAKLEYARRALANILRLSRPPFENKLLVALGDTPKRISSEYTPDRIAQLVAVEAAAKALAHHVRRSINVGPLSKSPAREAVLWRELRSALGEDAKE